MVQFRCIGPLTENARSAQSFLQALFAKNFAEKLFSSRRQTDLLLRFCKPHSAEPGEQGVLWAALLSVGLSC